MPLALLTLLASSGLPVYFGNGCFWARQHTFVTALENSLLNRSSSQLTSIAAYAGGSVPPIGRLCYDNANATDQYSDFGAAEVVAVELDDTHQLEAAARVYFSTFIQLAPGVWARPDAFDVGAQYRALIGVPGGLTGKHGAALRAASLRNLTLVADAIGKRPDTLGTNRVYVMDSDAFPPLQAEVCLQFHDDQTVSYPAEYHANRAALLRSGRLRANGCPRNFVC